MRTSIFYDEKAVLLKEPTDLASTDTQSGYIDLANWDECVIEVIVSTLSGVDGSNYLTPILQCANSSPTAAGSYSAVPAADMDYEIVTAAGASTVALDTVWPRIDSTSEDSVIYRAAYKGAARYLNVKLDYTGSGITAGVVGVVARLSSAHKQPGNANTVTTGTVS